MKIILPLPPTTNSTYKVGNGHIYKSKEAQQWRKDSYYEVKEKYPKHERFGTKRVEVFLDICYVREPDIEGCVKTILDLLQELEVYKNDRQVDDLHVHKQKVRSLPHVVITVEENGNL